MCRQQLRMCEADREGLLFGVSVRSCALIIRDASLQGVFRGQDIRRKVRLTTFLVSRGIAIGAWR
jgi:hypothetical protein